MHITEREAGDLDRLKRLARIERDAEQRDRLHAATLAIERVPTAEAQRMLGRSRGFVQRWAYAYRDGGIAAVARVPHPGRPPRMHPGRYDQLRARLDAGPRDGDGVCTLRGKDVRRILATEFDVRYSLSAVYDTLHRLGYSCLAPRPRHEHGDPAAVEKFKAQTPLF